MVRLHELSPGGNFDDLLVEVFHLEGMEPNSKPKDPVYSAVVRDLSGYARLIYRANNKCSPSNVKRGKMYLVSGQVTSYKGHLQIQVGSSWGKVEKVNGTEFPYAPPPYSPAFDFSAPEHRYGVLLLRASSNSSSQGGCSQLLAYLMTEAGAVGVCPVPSAPASYGEAERAAACRSLDSTLRMAPGSYHLINVPPVLHAALCPAHSSCNDVSQALQASGDSSNGATYNNWGPSANSSRISAANCGSSTAADKHQAANHAQADVVPPANAPTSTSSSSLTAWHIYCALLTCPTEQVQFAVGEDIGRWVPVEQLGQLVHESWLPCLNNLGASLRTAHAVGLASVAFAPLLGCGVSDVAPISLDKPCTGVNTAPDTAVPVAPLGSVCEKQLERKDEADSSGCDPDTSSHDHHVHSIHCQHRHHPAPPHSQQPDIVTATTSADNQFGDETGSDSDSELESEPASDSGEGSGSDDDADQHGEHGHEEEGAGAEPTGSVYQINGGGAELQEFLEAAANVTTAKAARDAAAGAVPAPVACLAVAVVDWYAPWAGPCREAAPEVDALASANPYIAFARLDVMSSQANEALAREKVMASAVARRTTTRPVLKSGDKWPCYTLHLDCALQPAQLFSGTTALQQLREAVEQYKQEPGATHAVQARPTVHATHAGKEATVPAPPQLSAGGLHSRSRVDTKVASAGPAGESEGLSSHDAKPRVSFSEPEVVVAAVPIKVHHLKRGAADLKQHLSAAVLTAEQLILAWLPPTASAVELSSTFASAHAMLRKAAAAAASNNTPLLGNITSSSSSNGANPSGNSPDLVDSSGSVSAGNGPVTLSSGPGRGALGGVRLVVAEAATSTANRALADAFKVEELPVLQLYEGSKMVKSLKGPQAVSKMSCLLLAKCMPEAPAAAGASTTPGGSVTAAGTGPAAAAHITLGTPAAEHPQPTLIAASQQQSLPDAALVTASSAGSDGTNAGLTIYDPPIGKYCKAGTTRNFPGRGKAVFWPRMPCLRCGCPWWRGADWDADCVRCEWSCEADGYDDDSVPLPQYKAKYDAFTASLRAGKTPAWAGKQARS